MRLRLRTRSDVVWKGRIQEIVVVDAVVVGVVVGVVVVAVGCCRGRMVLRAMELLLLLLLLL